ncbi:NAD(P)/FAD-dependent oxidoreductase [bacterium]|nr:NAD(P)/FAD-dependent oxidoreductase [bacterium]
MTEHFDVVVVGAGISGIGAGCHLRAQCPDRTFVILEGRADIGGTWDLFRYPGIRSDSDMYTLGYSFKPWTEAKAIADGPSILNYLRETAVEHGVMPHIRFGHHVDRADWDSTTARWTVEATHNGRTVRVTCNFLFMCSGYYDYAQGYTPDFAGREDFAGRIVHPQHWPADLDYAGKRVIVIGSGATAVTLVPAMAKTAGHVVMLQRSPTYVVSRPAEDGFANWLRRWLPPALAYAIVRWRNVLLQLWFFNFARSRPRLVKRKLLEQVREQLGADYDIATHFTPRYNPWDQRLCLVPDADLFAAIKDGRASVVTDHIERFTARGIRLQSGRELEADVIVTATGLNLQFLSDLEATVDGRRVEFPQTYGYKGMMYSGVPNLASSFGYTNASWTLKADLTCEYVCRLLNHMRATGTAIATPTLTDPDVAPEQWIDFSSGYFQRSLHKFPKQGSKLPWKLHQNYARDILLFRYGAIDDGTMRFTKPGTPVVASPPAGEPLRHAS